MDDRSENEGRAKIIRVKHAGHEQTLSFLQRRSVAGQGQGLDRGQSQDQLADSHFGGNMLASFGREGAVHKRGGVRIWSFFIFVFSSCMHGKFVIPRTILAVTVRPSVAMCFVCMCNVCLLKRCE